MDTIRVVLFGGGPGLEWGARQFIVRLNAHPEITFLGAFCQSPGATWNAVVRDLWQRRGFLAGPLLVAQLGSDLGRQLTHPRAERVLRRQIACLSESLHFVPDIHAKAVLEAVQALNPDLGLIYGSPILKPTLFEIPTFGTLGIHHGKLPEYRGKKTTFWAMYNGEPTAAVTIQRVNAGLDTGQIVKEGKVVIGRRSRGQVWRELETLGIELYLQAILEVKAGTAVYRSQNGPKGKLYGDPTPVQLLKFSWRQLNRYFNHHLLS